MFPLHLNKAEWEHVLRPLFNVGHFLYESFIISAALGNKLLGSDFGQHREEKEKEKS